MPWSLSPSPWPHPESTCCGACAVAPCTCPATPPYDEARVPWNLQVDARPAAVAYPAFPSEVADVVRAAPRPGLKVAPQGTGHGAPPLAGRLEDAVLLRTSAMTELHIDAERRTARVGAGVRWGDVVERAGAVGLAARHTTSPGVGVVGSSLGGGLSWYARHAGLQCSALTAVELVLADGTFVRATDTADSRPAVGRPRRRRRLRRRHRAGVRPAAGDRGCTPACSPGTGRRRTGCCAPGASGPATRPRPSPASPGCSRPRTSPGCRPTSAGGGSSSSTRSPSGTPSGARGCSRRCGPCGPRSTPSTSSRPPSVARLHLDPEAPTAVYANSVLLDDLPERAVEALVAAAGPDSGSELLFVELRQLGRSAVPAGAARRRAGPHGRLLPRAGRRDRHRRRLGGGARRHHTG